MEFLLIQPFRQPLDGIVRLPGSKSVTNRALLLAALSRESLTLEGALFSEDTRIMCDALEALGFRLRADAAGNSLFVMGASGRIPCDRASLHVGNAGTAARFLTAALALHPDGHYRLDGVPAMRKRPIKGLLEALRQHAAVDPAYEGEAGCFPFSLHTHGLAGGIIAIDASASSQILSAVLMVAPLARESLTISLQGPTVSRPFIDMTLAMMCQFGCQAVQNDDNHFSFQALPHGYYYGKPAYVIEPDATAASYFMTLPKLTGGRITLPGCARVALQGDIDYLKIVHLLGGSSEVDGDSLSIHYEDGKAAAPVSWDFNDISDTFLTMAAISPLLPGPTNITGIGHTRKQETDRVAAMATELRKLGQNVEEHEDSLTIHPDPQAMRQISRDQAIRIETYHDHRVAMSFGILGSHDLHGDGRPWIEIGNPGCCAKTYPAFFKLLHTLNPASDSSDAPPVFA